MHFLDDTDMNRTYICTWTMVFDDVLDADKLAAALTRLAELGDWKKIGARLRLNVSEHCPCFDAYLASISRPLDP